MSVMGGKTIISRMKGENEKISPLVSAILNTNFAEILRKFQ
jgi:hypothetical protein